jgi:nitronate monooxygenase
MTSRLLSALGLTLPVLAAPMAGGAGTPALVAAAARAGGLGFLSAGYRSPQALAAEITSVAGTGLPFGVNLFAPNPVLVDPAAFRHYAELIAAEAQRYGITLDSSAPCEDDDSWHDKIDVLLTHPVPVVSFTFGIPASSEVTALRATGALLIQSVTNAAEAGAAAEAGMDALVVPARLQMGEPQPGAALVHGGGAQDGGIAGEISAAPGSQS